MSASLRLGLLANRLKTMLSGRSGPRSKGYFTHDLEVTHVTMDWERRVVALQLGEVGKERGVDVRLAVPFAAADTLAELVALARDALIDRQEQTIARLDGVTTRLHREVLEGPALDSFGREG